MGPPLTVHIITAHPTALSQPPSSASVPAALTKPAPSSVPVPRAAHAPATAAPSSMTCSFEMTLPSLSVFWANEMTRLGASRPANCIQSGRAGDDHSGWGGGASKLHTQKHAPLGTVLTIHEGCRCTGDGGRRGAEDSAHPQTDRNFATQNKNSRSNSMEPGSRAPPPYLDRGEGCSVVSPLTHLDRGERCSVCLQRLALLLLERVELHEALGHCGPARARSPGAAWWSGGHGFASRMCAAWCGVA